MVDEREKFSSKTIKDLKACLKNFLDRLKAIFFFYPNTIIILMIIISENPIKKIKHVSGSERMYNWFHSFLVSHQNEPFFLPCVFNTICKPTMTRSLTQNQLLLSMHANLLIISFIQVIYNHEINIFHKQNLKLCKQKLYFSQYILII